jgi:Zn-dependent protease with chaperone function
LFAVTVVQLGVICVKYRLEAGKGHIEASFMEYFRFNVFGPVFYDIIFASVTIVIILTPVFEQNPVLFCVGYNGLLISIVAFLMLFPMKRLPIWKQPTPLDRGRHPLVWDVISRSNISVNLVAYAELSGLKIANAFQSGAGKNSVIVLSSYLEKILNEEETAAVVAHELAHVLKRHFHKTVLAPSVLAFLVINAYTVLTALNSAALLSRGLWSLIVVLLTFVGIAFLLFIFPWMSRRWETDADAYASLLVSPDAMASALVKMAENTLVYGSTSKRIGFLRSHPVLDSRIRRISSSERRKGAAPV